MKLECPVAIIGAGCVLPGAPDVKAFWNLLRSGVPQFHPLSDSRLPRDLYLDPDSTAPDTTYSNLAAAVDNELFFDSSSSIPRGHQMVLKALEEAIRPMSKDIFHEKRVAVVLGCMNPEEKSAPLLVKSKRTPLAELLGAEFTQAFDQAFKPFQENTELHFPNSMAALIHKTLGTQGPAFCVDSACASSLTAIDIAALLLETNSADLVITGGIEANLGIETYVPFSRLGVLARQCSLPYDSRSEGIVQGEGSVIFVCQRLADYKPNKNTVWGVIEAISSSSNGSQASLFSPSYESQKRNFDVIERAESTITPCYVEGHGTGTLLGDSTELRALRDGLSVHLGPVYLGSVKSVIGHTKGTAGAAGLLKSVLILSHRLIPASPYFEEPSLNEPLGILKINEKEISLTSYQKPLTARVCSAGFGGANYYLSVSEYRGHHFINPLTDTSFPPKNEVVLIGKSHLPYSSSHEHGFDEDWKVPPTIQENLDSSQICGLRAVQSALDRSLIPYQSLSKVRTGVIYAAHTRTELIEKLILTLQLKRVIDLSQKPSEQLAQFRHSIMPLDENSCQCLSSMTSGRIAHAFNFQGTNFHLDADFASQGYALQIAKTILNRKQLDVVLVLGIDEKPTMPKHLILRDGMTCWILTHKDFADLNQFPALATILDFQLEL